MISNLPIIGFNGLRPYELAYQRSPIILRDGIAKQAGGYLPIIFLTEFSAVIEFIKSSVTGGDPLAELYAIFNIQGGTSLLQFASAEYPFMNAQTAVNFQMQMPNTIIFEMLTPFKKRGDIFLQLPLMTALIQTLKRHKELGGYFMLLTPSYIYPSCILDSIIQIEYQSNVQLQLAWQWAFKEPLLTENQAEIAYNTAMDKIEGKTPAAAINWFNELL